MMRRMLKFLFAVLLATASVHAGERPNVVLIISDDQGWTDFGFMGSTNVRTPNLDKLASQSAVFTNGYVPMSLCRPSLASMMTGLLPSQHKICSNDFTTVKDPEASHQLIKQVPTFPRLLAEQGYLSFQTGKFWEGHFSNAGFTDGMTVKGRHGDDGLVIGRKTMQPIFDFVDKSVAEKKPFVVWYAPMLPHTPHNPPKRILDKYAGKSETDSLDRYYANCEWLDETVGQLREFLDQRKLADNTIILFVVDNGWLQDRKDINASVRSKRTPYDAGLRTPILVSYPGHTKPGRYEDLVSSLDLAPTILAASGAAKPELMHGVNLLDRASGGAPLDRDVVCGEIFTHDGVSLDDPLKSMTHRWIRAGDFKLIQPVAGKGEAELYDVKSDPGETTNLAAQKPDVVARLRERLSKLTPGS
jgi:uncharacterized sulfatase